jgi:small-conductance mechanosensitive channel
MTAIFANVAGAVGFSVKLFTSLVTSLVLMLIFLAIAKIIRGLIGLLVHHRTAESAPTFRAHADRIQKDLIYLTHIALIGYWTYLVFAQFGLLYYLERWWHAITDIAWQIGEVTISIGALIDFSIVLLATWLVARLSDILLDLELFSRYQFPRGVPAAIKMITRYLIITVGTIFALTVLGIKLTDLSLIAGALGVGIGFGLRNIMANFVSGLLLVFERPVQQGDAVEVGGVFGDVQKIGIRATTIKTYDGSEVIVPNADFITKEVTNWTLSSKSRRIKMVYKTALDSDPYHVIETIRQAVEAQSEIRTDPKPKVLFDGYGDYFLQFTVYFWVDEKLLDIKSQTALAIYEALKTANIQIPTPPALIQHKGEI